MRILSALTVIGLGLAATACTVVEHERPAPVVVQQPTTQPMVIQQQPPPAVAVRPLY